MANPTYLVGVNPAAVPGGPLRQTLVLTSDITAGSSSVSVNGTSVSNPNFNDSTPAAPGGSTNVIWQHDLLGNVSAYVGSTSSAFNAITSGTNTTATMTVGTGGTLTFSGTGVVNARKVAGIDVSGNAPTHPGMLLISQPGNTSAIWADPQVQGLYDAGSTISPAPAFVAPTNIQPVLMGASDGAVLRNVASDASGQVKVLVQNTPAVTVSSGTITTITNPVTVTGSVSATQGTSPWVVSLTSTTITGTVAVTQSTSPWIVAGNKSVNTAAGGSTNVSVLSAQANTVNPAWTDGFAVPLSVDTSGNLRVSATGGGGTQYTDGTTQATPTGTVALGKNPSNILHALSLDASGFMNVNIAAGSSNASVSATGAAVPAFASFIGLQDDAGNLRGAKSESAASSNLRVAIFSGGNLATVTGQNALTVTDLANTTANSTTAPTKIIIVGGKTNDGTPQYQALPLSAGGAAVFVTGSGTFTTSDTNFVSQATTTSGQKGPLVQGAVTTNDPTYTTAQTDPLSLTTTGHLRTHDSATSSANGSTAVPTNALFVGAKGADGFLHGLKSSTNDGALDVNATFSGTVTPGFVADITQSGAITNTQNVALVTSGAASLVFNLTGVWTGTISFEASADGTNWVPATCYAKFPSGAGVTSTTINGQWTLPVGGVNSFRVRGNTVSSGTATAWLEKGAGGLAFESVQQTAANLNMTATQGQAASNANAWTAKVTDGTNVLGTSANPFITQDKADGAPATASQPAEAMQVAGWDGTHLRVLSTDSSGNLNVNAAGTFTPALTPDRTATGTITNTQNVPISTAGGGGLFFNITGVWTGTIVFEASIDGTNWVSANVVPRFATADRVTQTTANGQWAISVGGLNSFRVRGSTVGSGTATIWLEVGAGAQDVEVISPDQNNFLVTAYPTASSTSNALSVQTVNTSSVSILSANANRKEMTITNTGLTVLFLGLGQTPTTTQYHIALAACSSANDGTGGTYTSDIWKGQVNAISSAVSGTTVVTELT